jgi:hypothetical protein
MAIGRRRLPGRDQAKLKAFACEPGYFPKKMTPRPHKPGGTDDQERVARDPDRVVAGQFGHAVN